MIDPTEDGCLAFVFKFLSALPSVFRMLRSVPIHPCFRIIGSGP